MSGDVDTPRMRGRPLPRLSAVDGFTLIELLVVIVVLGVLVGIAVPAYLSFRHTGEDAAAKSNVRTAIPAAESFYAHSGNSYTGMDNAALQLEAPQVSGNVDVTVLHAGQGYCLDDTHEGNGSFYYVGGDAGSTTLSIGRISPGACS
jgi:prepilin-type N-terminal cleavage/methylation domain-containing protein